MAQDLRAMQQSYLNGKERWERDKQLTADIPKAWYSFRQISEA